MQDASHLAFELAPVAFLVSCGASHPLQLFSLFADGNRTEGWVSPRVTGGGRNQGKRQRRQLPKPWRSRNRSESQPQEPGPGRPQGQDPDPGGVMANAPVPVISSMAASCAVRNNGQRLLVSSYVSSRTGVQSSSVGYLTFDSFICPSVPEAVYRAIKTQLQKLITTTGYLAPSPVSQLRYRVATWGSSRICDFDPA
jgi:hypothetical protein